MKRLTIPTILLAVLAILPARADLGIEYADRSSAVIFRDGDHAYFEMCGGHVPHPRRGCSGKDLSQIYSAGQDTYLRSVQSFYGLIDREYAGARGTENLDSKIQGLKEHLDNEDLTVEELKRAEALLRHLVTLKDKSDRADRDILRYLESDAHAIFSEEFQSERTQIAQLSFYGVAYLKEQQTLFRLTEPVAWGNRTSACAEFGSTWQPATAEEPLRRELTPTALVGAGETAQVWTGSSWGGGCRLTCAQYGNTYVPDSFSRDGSCDGLRSEQERMSRSYGSGGICQYSHGLATGAYSIDFIPRLASVAAFGASFESSEETIEASEGALSETSHPTLCRKSFRMEHDDSDSGYLNEPHFASFSLPELESSLSRLAQSVYANRAEFFRQVSRSVAEHPTDEQARLFVLMALDPLMHDIHSRFVDRYVVPDYEQAKEHWSKKLKITALGEIAPAPGVYHEAVALLHSALEASKPYLAADERKVEEELVPILGQAMAEGPGSRAKVVEELTKRKTLLEHLATGARTRGFGVMIASLESYLEKH